MQVQYIENNYAYLTKNQIYEVISFDTDAFEIKIGNSKNLFVRSSDFIVIEPEKTTYSVDLDSNTNYCYISFSNNKIKKTIGLKGLEVAGNCGTLSLEGINYLCGVLSTLNLLTKNHLTVIFTKIINFYKKNNETAFLLFSTNNVYPILWEVLDEMSSIQTNEKINPNSDLPIKIWIFEL